ncbi:FixH family protein [Luteimonas sp. FCS-9]|uniref:FixH family protein n=1 Tax=Luteimonas sp. FCS-9 TaxID=1547516 RepID=UPI00063E9612|nr:FixH family protein [Luteimonas sp. FCS-9]KLJ01962.1 FixH [Luteimonas sp. FCS-9]
MKDDKRPLWRIPVMWLVIGLPLASIVAGVGLVVIATRSGGADVVTDDVRRVSQIQTADLGPDARARQMALSAIVRIDESVVEVIPATGTFPRNAALQLVLQHPTQSRDDLQLELAPTETGWRSSTRIDDGHDWILQLAPADGAWRLHGRLPRQQHAARLAPSLQP